MTRKPTPSRLASILALVAAGLLAVAIAGPVAAHDHRGFGDDDPAGTIASFDPTSGQLVIDLADGGSVAGIVTRRTWIKSDHGEDCDDERRGRLLHGWCHNGAKASSGDHDWSHGHGRGDSDDLVTGAVVEDAILVLVDGKAIFAKVDLDD